VSLGEVGQKRGFVGPQAQSPADQVNGGSRVTALEAQGAEQVERSRVVGLEIEKAPISVGCPVEVPGEVQPEGGIETVWIEQPRAQFFARSRRVPGCGR
jgi:hypothetical protein